MFGYKILFKLFRLFPCYVMVIGCLAVPHRLLAQDDLQILRQEWRHSPGAVVRKLIDYRRHHKRTAEIDYMIATGCCRSSGLRGDAPKWFAWILQHYWLTDKARAVVKEERDKCGSQVGLLSPIPDVDYHGASVGGKGGEREPVLIAKDPAFVENVHSLQAWDMTDRLFEQDASEKGIDKVKALAGPNFTVTSNGHFILASSSQINSQDLSSIADTLERYMQFYANTYQLPIPSELITIYMVPTSNEMKQLARRLHGLKVFDGTFGYSFSSDQSIVALIPSSGIGTLMHELFHTMTHARYQDLPPWLDEGVAALYEVSRAEGDHIVGLPNWRGPILQASWQHRPSLTDLVKFDWTKFNNVDMDISKTSKAVNEAMARYFVMYLQEEGKLTQVFRAFLARQPEDVVVDPGTDAVTLLESILGLPLASVDARFSDWFETLPNGNSSVISKP